MTKLEQIARAICSVQTVGNDPDEMMLKHAHPGPIYRPRWTFFLNEARATVEAMREPTHWMVDAGWDAAPKQNRIGQSGVRAIYSYMLQAILDEHGEATREKAEAS